MTITNEQLVSGVSSEVIAQEAEKLGVIPTELDMIALRGLCEHTYPQDPDEALKRFHILEAENRQPINLHDVAVHGVFLALRNQFSF